MQADPLAAGSTSPSNSSSLKKKPKDSPDEYMNEMGKTFHWSALMQKDTTDSWYILLLTIFNFSPIGFSNKDEIEEMMDYLNENEEQMNIVKEAARQGVVEGKWTDFFDIISGECLSDCLLVPSCLSKVTSRKCRKSRTTEWNSRILCFTSCVSFVSSHPPMIFTFYSPLTL